jgi:hypothetical protein
LDFRPYTAELVQSVKAFNQRLREGGHLGTFFPETNVPNYPKQANTDIYQERFLLLHDGQVRGGYVLTHQSFFIRGRRVPITCGPQLALSEGVVNPHYGTFGVLILEDALARHPLMYGLGMSGIDGPLSKLMGAMGWTLYRVPLYFKVVKPSRFLANISYLRKRRGQRIALDFLRYTGLGHIGIWVAQNRMTNPESSIRCETFQEFEDWADELWEQSTDEYSWISLRDSKTLNVIYPPHEKRFLRLKVSRGHRPLGWVVMRDDQMSGDKRFGNMRAGLIMDCLAGAEHASSVVQAATRHLENRGVDLILSNQASAVWCNALSMNGFLAGPSTFALGLSQDLAEKLRPFQLTKDNVHINRGNGHGPILKW